MHSGLVNIQAQCQPTPTYDSAHVRQGGRCGGCYSRTDTCRAGVFFTWLHVTCTYSGCNVCSFGDGVAPLLQPCSSQHTDGLWATFEPATFRRSLQADTGAPASRQKRKVYTVGVIMGASVPRGSLGCACFTLVPPSSLVNRWCSPPASGGSPHRCSIVIRLPGLSTLMVAARQSGLHERGQGITTVNSGFCERFKYAAPSLSVLILFGDVACSVRVLVRLILASCLV